jgi:diadenosine tetraphosphatase ApaH/serine/threonine PP2A family protein phosphatase
LLELGDGDSPRPRFIGPQPALVLIALLTDIHGNREALDACLAHTRRMGPDRYIFLGDYVGYGADPGYAVDLVEEFVARGAIALRGNHDDAVVGSSARMNDAARAAIEWTRGRLDERQRRFLADLPFVHEEGGRLFVHANAVAPQGWGYVTNRLEAARSLRATRCDVVFCGHLHVPGVYHMAPNGVLGEFIPVDGRSTQFTPDRRWLAVLGAVGQPRDRNPAACYAVLDDQKGELTYFRVPYDVATAADKILDAGLPPPLAARLFQGS